MFLQVTRERNISAAGNFDKFSIVFMRDRGGEVVQSLTTIESESRGSPQSVQCGVIF